MLRSNALERSMLPMEGALYGHHHWPEDGSTEEAAERQTASLAAVVVILVLLIGGLFLVQQLRTSAQIEDCLLSGRSNCDTLVAHQHGRLPYDHPVR
jgi:hypothetical protein